MLRLFIFATPGGPCFEIGEKLAEFYDIDFLTLEHIPEKRKSYFDDKIPAVYFDAGDFMSGSASQQFVRDPKSLQNEKILLEKDPTIISPETITLSEEEKFEIFQVEQGIISSQIAEMFLCDWATHVVFLNSDITKTIKWFEKRRVCPSCDSVYHLDERPTKYFEICDRCGTQLTIMPQDKPEIMKSEFKVFKKHFWKFKEKAKQCAKFIAINVDECKDFQEIYAKIDLAVKDAIEKKTSWY